MIARVAAVVALSVAVMANSAAAQRGAAPAPTPRASAPVDLTGYWVSVVSEDWRYRMVTPPKGDFGGVPLNAEGRKVAEAWDSARDTASDNACKWYGAAGIMRIPGRLHITWQGDDTLKLETDAGQQVRLLHLGRSPQPPAEASWQGETAASWDGVGGRGAAPRWASLRAVTTHLRPGYLRKNGVPYSQDAVLTEYFDRHSVPDGSDWITVTSIVLDPTYLTQEFITSTDFKKEPDGSKWTPAACDAR